MVFPHQTVTRPDLYVYCKVDIEAPTKHLIESGNLDNYNSKTKYFKQKIYDTYGSMVDYNPTKNNSVRLY